MLILASASPRRRELMEKLHTPFVCEPAAAPEVVPDGLPAALVPEHLAAHKAEEVFQKHAAAASDSDPLIVIGSDTVVLCNGKILGKPHSRDEAAAMLRLLSGRTHEVLTGVCLRSAEKTVRFTSRTEVEFYPLSEMQITAYIESGEPMDKAGAYGIQGDGALLVKGICGDYYTVMGFPVARIARELEAF